MLNHIFDSNCYLYKHLHYMVNQYFSLLKGNSTNFRYCTVFILIHPIFEKKINKAEKATCHLINCLQFELHCG